MVSTRNIRLLLLLLVLLATLGVTTRMITRSKPGGVTPGVPPQQTLPNNVDIALHNVRFTEMRGSAIAWELIASDATYSKSGDLATLHNITMKFAATRNAGSCTVTAREGTYSNTSRNVTLRGAVHVETENNARFDTESLDYNAARSLFLTKEHIRFSHDRMTLNARGMELDVVHQKAHFLHETDAVVSGLQQ